MDSEQFIRRNELIELGSEHSEGTREHHRIGLPRLEPSIVGFLDGRFPHLKRTAVTLRQPFSALCIPSESSCAFYWLG